MYMYRGFFALRSAALLGGCLAVNLIAEAGPGLSSLEDGDKVKIEYQSRGCFSNSSSSLLITASSVQLDDLGQRPLTEDTARSLDEYFDRLDRNDPGGCTTTDYIEITRTNAAGQTRQWSYEDAHCFSTLKGFPEYAEHPDAFDGLTISELIYQTRRALEETDEAE